MQKILLYYKFAPVADPAAVRLWQRTLCERLALNGRIIISPQGINGTVGGELAALKRYVKETRQYEPFHAMAFTWSDGNHDDFPKLSVKVRPELVTFGVPDELRVTASGIAGGGRHLQPEEVHELVAERGNVVFFDGRNRHEAAIGRFQNAIVPDVEHSRDFAAELDSGKYDHIKDKPVVTYCTGGIRCEVLSVLMKNRGFQEVYQLEGGIARYGETYGDQGLWEGSLYVFDDRLDVQFSDQAAAIGECVHCRAKTSRYANCANVRCNKLMLVCRACNEKSHCLDCSAVAS
jgi:UPF0176 protein